MNGPKYTARFITFDWRGRPGSTPIDLQATSLRMARTEAIDLERRHTHLEIHSIIADYQEQAKVTYEFRNGLEVIIFATGIPGFNYKYALKEYFGPDCGRDIDDYDEAIYYEGSVCIRPTVKVTYTGVGIDLDENRTKDLVKSILEEG